MGVFYLRFFMGMVGVLLLTGCSSISTVRDYNKNITNYTGDKKVGVAFDTDNNQVRVYPETKACIDLYSASNGFLPRGAFDFRGLSDKKRIGIPEVEGMRKISQEYWVSANNNIAIRVIYTGDTGTNNFFSLKQIVSESVIVFKPQPGAFYYVKVDFDNQSVEARKYLRVYQIIEGSTGGEQLKHVEILNVKNCPGQKPWYMKGGAII
ncbi:putative lipoprotein [Pectobacterium atrosepticum SCRI1043]|uniref:Lipoprotein n=1 Tax=Pectobacterium atrosepticum (strain SCRI 1043 / ATCC BAA-672) TaxID=218491 RepID=Q6D6V3_PECAS|nr:hypothetical protein [Pectobacterium atrosepticum]GKV84785.1 hypothetical protein PEC301296_10970 [Pectobacterium carotovorum subsp. carotovorum]AIA70521.1 hypothetical protein EV46_07960 [Pectobacterium atrosepticum]AIK13441.1 putative lipoprotein [Pectobacterium atrosepticum]ATY90338.1 hypothetical protein CVS35_08190 [Pectobacterium atrosepticum]KFX16452.1 hypothetical protein JV34_06625 [Pectobacterium atrosepticum]